MLILEVYNLFRILDQFGSQAGHLVQGLPPLRVTCTTKSSSDGGEMILRLCLNDILDSWIGHRIFKIKN